MASPEVVESSGTLDSSLQEELSAPVGWKKKLMPRKTGTPKRMDVVYVAPNGEEIRNKRQLDKYLKNHSGGPSSADFDWSTGETPRRSARLSTKGRLSSDSMDAEPVSKRSKAGSEDEASVVVSPRKSSRRKSGAQAPAPSKDETMEDAEKAQDEDNTAGDGIAVSSAAAPAEEKVAVASNEAVENNTDEKIVEAAAAVEIGEAKIGESAEQLTATELTSVENSTDKERRGCSRGSRDLHETHRIPQKCSLGNCSSSSGVAHGPWDPTDSSHLLAVKTALHLSAVPDTILCRDSEQARVLNFCKGCIMNQRAGSIYICGCPGTGKSLTIEKVKLLCSSWSKEAGGLHLETVGINCTSLTDPRHIYLRVLQAIKPGHATNETNKNNDVLMGELKQLISTVKSSKPKSSRRML